MNRFDLATKIVGGTVAVLALAGLFSAQLMDVFMPFILIGTAVTFVLFVIAAFKTKHSPRIIATVLLAAFVAVIVIYNRFF